MLLLVIIGCLMAALAPTSVAFTNEDYAEVLQMSIDFYETQKSGPFPSASYPSWRGDSAMFDGSDNNVDLKGGWYDAGDHMKFGYPMAFSTTLLLWGAVEYWDVYEAQGLDDAFKQMIRTPLDYFVKAHTAPNELYVQVGTSGADHSYWGRPEDMTMERPSYAINTECPGSDVAAETAAALAAGSILFAVSDPDYSQTLLGHAVELYAFAQNYRGKYSDCPGIGSNYPSYTYVDELVWGGLWLYRATNDSTYMTQAEEFFNNNKDPSFGWDSKKVGCQLLMYQLTLNTIKLKGVNKYIIDWMPGGTKFITPGGLNHKSNWGTLRYSANTAWIFLHAYNLGVADVEAADWAKGQIDYMLGANPLGMSYVVGFGQSWPQCPHHRAASCPDPVDGSCGWVNYGYGTPNPHTIYGALVGGPASDDTYSDDRSLYEYSEVACDYNAGFQSALAALLHQLDGQ